MKSERLAGAFFRLWLVALGGMILLWSGREDSDLSTVAALGWLVGVSVFVWYGSKRLGVARMISWPLRSALLLGAGSGAAANLVTLALMLFKNARHGHAYPDSPLPVLLSVLETMPVWALAGGLGGLGMGILLRGGGAKWRAD